MFRLDLIIYNLILNNFKSLGSIFGYSSFEGAVMYLGIFTATILKVLNSNNKKVAKK